MKKICIISADPFFLGGVGLYTWNIVHYLKNNGKYEIFWVYKGREDKIYKKKGVTFVELKSLAKYPISEIFFNFRIKKFLEKNNFDIINSHAIWGFWLRNYKKEGQKMIHTYHGSTYHFFKNHFKRPELTKKVMSLFSAILGFFMEKPPWEKADKIICVSEHVKKELIGLYNKRKNVEVIVAGIDLKIFKPRDKKITRRKLGLDSNKMYGLYVGRGGYWTKGLDRVIRLSEEIYKINENYRLIVIGPDYNKIKRLISSEFVNLLPPQSRIELPFYYNASDIFFNLSRYEGGDPTLATGEAMASKCLIVCSKDAKQEVITDKENGLIIREDYEKEAKRIISLLNNKKEFQNITKNSLRDIRRSSLKMRREICERA